MTFFLLIMAGIALLFWVASWEAGINQSPEETARSSAQEAEFAKQLEQTLTLFVDETKDAQQPLLSEADYLADFARRKQQIAADFNQRNDPIAKHASWIDDRTFEVAVRSEGLSLDNYAYSVCKMLYVRGFKGEEIRVVLVDVLTADSLPIMQTQCW